jgi:SAM-dependent methyltransferase
MDDLLELTRQAEAQHFWFHGFRRFVTPVIHEIAAGRTTLELIDCGCGVGQNLPLLMPYGRVVGFDLAGGGVAAAHAAGHRVARADLTRIPFPSDCFDVATCFDVLQCVPDDRHAVGEIARIVRPGGYVVLTLAAFDVLRGDHAEVWDEQRRYTRTTARQLVESAGLRAARVRYMFASLFPLMLAVRTGQRLLRPVRGVQRDEDIRVPPAPINTALTWVVRREAALARRMPMPIGSSVLVVASK